MATGGNTQPAGTLACPLCARQFLVPRTLPCFHTVCEECLDSHIKQQEKEGTYDCQICHKLIVPRDTKVSTGDLASTFPLNNLINSIIEIQKDSNSDDYCEPCSHRKRKATAEVWCGTCQERLCSQCYECHKHMKLSKDHETVSIDEMKHLMKSKIVFDQNCAQHIANKLETFCVNHRALCCGVCSATNHRYCDDIRDITLAAENQAKICTYRDVIKQIEKIKTEMDKILADKVNNRSIIKTEKEEIINSMDTRIDNLIENLNALRVTFKKETENLYQETNNFIVKIENQIKCFQTNITNCQLILESIENEIASREKFIALETLLSQLTSHYEQLKSTTQDDVEIHFTLKANAALRDIEGLSSLGAVQTKHLGSFKNKMKTVDDVMKKLSTMSKLGTALSGAQIANPMTSRLTFVKAVAGQKHGRNTWFTGGTVLPDGRLLMSDWGNRRLVQVDEDYNMVKEYKVDRTPRDVAAGQTDNEIYIAVCQLDGGIYVVGSEEVYKCRLDTGLTVVRRIKAPLWTWGIAMSGDQVLVGAEDAVVILNQDGTTVKSIPRSGGGDVAVSQTQRAMYHRDGEDVGGRRVPGIGWTGTVPISTSTADESYGNLYRHTRSYVYMWTGLSKRTPGVA